MIYNNKDNSYCMIVNPPRHKKEVLQKAFKTNNLPPKLWDTDTSNVIWIKETSLNTDEDSPIYGIQIDNAFMSNKLYADGSRKISNEFNISFQNFIDGISETDIKVMLHYSRYHACFISNFYDWYNKAPRVCNDTSLLLGDKTYKNTHFYKELEYSVPLLHNHQKRSKYVSIFCDDVRECKLTATLHQEISGSKVHQTARNHYITDGLGYAEKIYSSKKEIAENYIWCNKCDNHAHKNVTIYDEDDLDAILSYYGYSSTCSYCYDKLSNSYLLDRARDFIRSYAYKPKAVFHSLKSATDRIKKSFVSAMDLALRRDASLVVGELFFGVELEIEARTSYHSKNRCLTAKEIVDDSHGFIYCKDDSSIADNYSGFEIVTHPITPSALKRLDLKKMIFRHSANFKSYHAKNCGMHIHVNKSAFNHNHLLRFASLINDNSLMTHFVSQRRRLSEYKSWSPFIDGFSKQLKSDLVSNIKHQKKEIRDGYQSKLSYIPSSDFGSRYQAVNLSNRATVEIRTFKGNLSEIGFRKNLDFVEAVYYFTKMNNCKMTVRNLVDYVKSNRKQYPSLNEYFQDNKNELKFVIKNPTQLQELN